MGFLHVLRFIVVILLVVCVWEILKGLGQYGARAGRQRPPRPKHVNRKYVRSSVKDNEEREHKD